MGNPSKKEQEIIRNLVHERLISRNPTAVQASSEQHLDDNTVAAFLEARLTEDESGPVVSHLIACSACRKLTAQLVCFDSDLDDSAFNVAEDESHGSLRQWFEDFKAGLSSSSEEVFAYQNPPETADDNQPSGEHPAGASDTGTANDKPE